MNTNTTPDTALTPLLEKATPEPWDAWFSKADGIWTVRARYQEGRARITAWPAVVNCGAQPNEANAALITAAVRSIRWAHSEAGVEAIALVISQVAWGNQTDSPMDGDRQVARAVVAALAKAGVGE